MSYIINNINTFDENGVNTNTVVYLNGTRVKVNGSRVEVNGEENFIKVEQSKNEIDYVKWFLISVYGLCLLKYFYS